MFASRRGGKRSVGDGETGGEREGRSEGGGGGWRGREGALMLVSLLDMLLIPLQEYQQYLTGNVTECQVGKCHWGRTGG